MKTLYALASGALLLALVGCGGGGTTTPNPNGNGQSVLDPTRTEAAVTVSADLASANLVAESAVAPMISGDSEEPEGTGCDGSGGQKMDRSCVTVEGNRRTGGSITYNDCQTPRGTLSGTVTWSVDDNGSRTTTRDLTFTRANTTTPLHITGTTTWTRSTDASNVTTIHQVGSGVTTDGTFEVDSSTDLTWTKQPASTLGWGRSFPTGTITMVFKKDGTVVKTVTQTFDGTNIVTVDVDGQTYTYQLDGHHDRPKPHPRGRGHGGPGNSGGGGG